MSTEDPIVLDEGSDGPSKQTYLSASYTPDELYPILLAAKQKGKKNWWQQLDVIKEGDPPRCWLKCTLCGTKLSPSNPSERARSHFGKACGKASFAKVLAAAAAARAAERNWSLFGQLYTAKRSRMGIGRGEMLAFVRGNATNGSKQDDFELEMQLLEDD